MLKFLRKYQLVLLAVGGSLLMVVFLLQPVLQQLTPDPRKKVIATLSDGTELRAGDRERAAVELSILEKFLPRLPTVLGLDPQNEADHWMLLKHEAEKAGVMGIGRDGSDWIGELAVSLVLAEVEAMRRQGQQFTGEQIQEQIENAQNALIQNRRFLLQQNRGLDEASFNRILSSARGVTRLRRLYDRAPRLSEQRSVRTALEQGTAVLTDQLVLGPELVMADIEEPGDDALAEQFEAYRDVRPGDTEANEFGFGYLLPPRVKMEWLTLDRRRIAEVVSPDPVAVRRRWQTENPDGGDFAADRGALENQIRQETVDQIMNDADEIVRGEILSATRGLEKNGIYRDTPEGWTAPDLEAIAGDVVDAIAERHGVRVPRPTVIRRTDSWLEASAIAQLPGVGRAFYRVGNQMVPVAVLPSLVRGVGEDTRVAVQEGIPVIDPPAQDGVGSKYYVTVLEARGESAPESFEEIRDRLVDDVKAKRAFEQLAGRLGSFEQTAQDEGLAAVAAMFETESGEPRVRVRQNIFVGSETIQAATFESFPDGRANVPAFRDAVREAGETLDPLAPADEVAAYVATPLPGSRSVVVASVRAKRPPAMEDYRRIEAGLAQATVRRMVDEAQSGAHPLDYGPLTDRIGYTPIGGGEDEAGDA